MDKLMFKKILVVMKLYDILKFPINYTYIPLKTKNVTKPTVITYWTSLIIILIASFIYYSSNKDVIEGTSFRIQKGPSPDGSCYGLKSYYDFDLKAISLNTSVFTATLDMNAACGNITFHRRSHFKINACINITDAEYDKSTETLLFVDCSNVYANDTHKTLHDLTNTLFVDLNFLTCIANSPETDDNYLIINFKYSDFIVNQNRMLFSQFTLALHSGKCQTINTDLYNTNLIAVANLGYLDCVAYKYFSNVKIKIPLPKRLDFVNTVKKRSEYICLIKTIREKRMDLGAVAGLILMGMGIIPMITKCMGRFDQHFFHDKTEHDIENSESQNSQLMSNLINNSSDNSYENNGRIS